MPMLIRWPGVIKPGTVYAQFFAHEDLLPTFAAAAGNINIVDQCMKMCQSGNKSFHVHLDGYNLMSFFKGEMKESPRTEFLYWSDKDDLFAIRVRDWKISFVEQHHEGFDIWAKGFERLRTPYVYNLHSDPFERGPNSSWYPYWNAYRVFLVVPTQAIVAKWLQALRSTQFAKGLLASISMK